jgi:pimeloyl-ACP methyl ester carboxylesterase
MAKALFRTVTLDDLGSIRPGQLARIGATPGHSTKVVFVHGFRSPPPDYRNLLEVLTKAGEHDVYAYHYRSLWGRAEKIARSLASQLLSLLREPGVSLVLVGHSLGGVLVRSAVLSLHRVDPSSLKRIDRLLLLSSTNRGFEPVGAAQGLLRNLAKFLRYQPTIMDGLRGSSWMTRLRIEWLETFGGVRLRPDFDESRRRAKGPVEEGDVVTRVSRWAKVPPHPTIVQIDGLRDRVVRPDDSDDLELFEGSVTHRRMPDIGHFDFALQGLSPGERRWRERPESSVAADADPARKAAALGDLARCISDAVIGRIDPPGHRRHGPGFGLAGATADGGTGAGGAVEPLAGGPPVGWLGSGAAPASLNIVFLIHGIRDYGSWHPPLEEILEKRLAHTPGFWRVVAIEYGYFSALQFLLPAQQNRVVHGFADRYLNEMTRAFREMIQLRRFLPVRVHIAAHSNGSNVLAQAIARDDGVSFSRVFLAGCVLRRDFWSRYSGRVFAVRNDCATDDWPVGVLCRALSYLSMFGYWFLGTAGVDGFAELPFVSNSRYLTGDHGAALEPSRMESIGEYLVSGQPRVAPVNAGKPSAMWPQRFALGSGALLLIGTLGLIYLRLHTLAGGWGLGLGAGLTLVLLAVFFGLLNF